LECTTALEYSKNLALHECRRPTYVKPAGSVKLAACVGDLKAKNDTLNDLRREYLVQSEALSNSSVDLRNCKQVQSQLNDKTLAAEEELRKCNGRVTGLEREGKDKVQACDNRLQGFRDIVREMQRHLQCLQTDESCGDIAGLYTCSPIDLMHQACTPEYVLGQELFGIQTCNMLSDQTWSSLDLKNFLGQNPKIFCYLIILLVLASVGLVTLLCACLWLLVRHRRTLFLAIRGCLAYCRPRRMPESSIVKDKKKKNKDELELKERKPDSAKDKADSEKPKKPKPKVNLNPNWSDSEKGEDTIDVEQGKDIPKGAEEDPDAITPAGATAV